MNTLERKFNELKESYTPVNVINYIDYCRSLPLKDLLENAQFVFPEPTKGSTFFLETLKSIHEGPIDIFESVYEKLLAYKDSHVFDYIREDVQLAGNDPTSAGFEYSECGQSSEQVLATLSEREKKFIEPLKNERFLFSRTVHCFRHETPVATALVYNSSLNDTLHIYVATRGDRDVDYRSRGWGELIFLKTLYDIKAKYPYVKQVVSMVHVDNDLGKKFLDRLGFKLGYSVRETVFQEREKYTFLIQRGNVKGVKRPDQGISDEEKERLIHHYNIITQATALVESRLVTDIKKSTLESFYLLENNLPYLTLNENIGQMAPIVELEPYTLTVGQKRKKLENDFSHKFVDIFMDDSDDIDMEALGELFSIAYEYDNLMSVTEGKLHKTTKKVAIAADKGARKAAVSMRKGMEKGREVKTIASKVPQHFERLVNSTIDKIANLDKSERRKRILHGGFRFKLLKLIRTAIILGVGVAIHPALAAITLLGQVAFERQLDNKVRKEIVHELELELQICEEKIRDASSAGDKKNKYNLMRIKSALEKDIERINYRLDVIRRDKKEGIHI